MLAAARTNLCPAKAIFDRFMWFMSDANDCCACDSAHVNWERESRDPFPRTLSGPVYLVTSCVFSGWTGCYLMIVKRLVLRIRNALETDLNLTAQTTHSRWNWTSLDASACWNHICTFYSSQNVTKQTCENMLYAIWHIIVRYDSAKAGAQIWGMQYMQCIGAPLCQNKSLKIFFNKAFKIFEKLHL